MDFKTPCGKYSPGGSVFPKSSLSPARWTWEGALRASSESRCHPRRCGRERSRPVSPAEWSNLAGVRGFCHFYPQSHLCVLGREPEIKWLSCLSVLVLVSVPLTVPSRPPLSLPLKGSSGALLLTHTLQCPESMPAACFLGISARVQ